MEREGSVGTEWGGSGGWETGISGSKALLG